VAGVNHSENLTLAVPGGPSSPFLQATERTRADSATIIRHRKFLSITSNDLGEKML
jgi:hypothetical protein